MSGLTIRSSDVSSVRFFGWASVLVHLLRIHKSNRWPKKNVLKCYDRKNEWLAVNIFYDTYTRYIFRVVLTYYWQQVWKITWGYIFQFVLFSYVWKTTKIDARSVLSMCKYPRVHVTSFNKWASEITTISAQ